MKNILFFFALVICWSCMDKNQIQIQKSEDGATSLTFNASKKYLLLPIEDIGEELKTEVYVDGKQVNYFIIRLAKNKIDYWMPLELTEWMGKNIQLIIPNLNDSVLCLKEIKMSDTFDFSYNEPFRSGYHFTPKYGWMNDPNGMVYYDGEYHLCYQHNPYGTRWQNMSWGHAVSKDLIHWEHLHEAIYPDSLGTIFSGSAVVDENNTAGFQSGTEKTLLAFYTQSERGGQWQSLAYSNDKGRTWTKYDKNPVLKHETARDFRDPKVFWHEPAQRWIMILAVGQVMEIYSSPNAKDWTYESNFGKGYGSHAGVWECPDLFELPVEGTNLKKWVLICNINPGGPSGGSASQYFIGSFDGKTFKCENKPEEICWMDWGKDHYAFVTWANVPKEDGRRVGIAWMSNWEYANDVPTYNFRSAMTIPRELKLIMQDKNITLTNYPVRELENQRKDHRKFSDITVSEEYNVDNLLEKNQGTYELVIDIENQSAEIIGFKLFNTKGEYVDMFISLAENKLYMMDRKNSGIVGFNNNFPAITSAPVDKKQTYRFRLLVDKASIECFEGNGTISMTNIVFPNEPYNRMVFYSKGGNYSVNKLDIYRFKY